LEEKTPSSEILVAIPKKRGQRSLQHTLASSTLVLPDHR
jgi:hypothetical protein